MNEISNQKSNVPPRPRRKGTLLDKSFPGGVVLLLILAFVVFLQVLSAWKIMNIERERADLEAKKKNYKVITQLLPKLQREIGEKERKHIELRGKVSDLNTERIQVRGELQELIKESNELKSSNNLMEIELKNQEKRLLQIKSLVFVETEKKNKILKEFDSLEAKVRSQKIEESSLNNKIEIAKRNKNKLQEEIERLELTIVNSELREVIEDIRTSTNEFKKSQFEVQNQMQNSIKKLENAANNMGNAASGIEQETVDFVTKTGAVISSIKNSSKQFIEINSKIANLSLQLDETISTANEWISKYQEKQKEIISTLDRLSEIRQQIENSAELFESDRGVFKQTVESFKKESDDVIKKMSGLEKENLKNQKEIISTLDKLNEIRQQIEDSAKLFESNRGAFKQTVESFKKESDDVIKKISGLEKENIQN